MTLKTIIKDNSIIIRSKNSGKDLFLLFIENLIAVISLELVILLTFLASESLYYLSTSYNIMNLSQSLSGLVGVLFILIFLPAIILIVIVNIPIYVVLHANFNFILDIIFHSYLNIFIFCLIEQILGIFLLTWLRNPQKKLTITHDNIRQHNFLIFDSKYSIDEWGILLFRKQYVTRKFNPRSKLKCFWTITNQTQQFSYTRFFFKLQTDSFDEILEIVDYIRQLFFIPVEIEENMNFINEMNFPTDTKNIKISELPNNSISYSLKIRSSTYGAFYVFYNLFITLSILLALFKLSLDQFYIMPQNFSSAFESIFLIIYEFKLILTLFFFLLLLYRIYLLFELFHFEVLFSFNKAENELRIYLKRPFLLKTVFLHALDSIQQVCVVKTSLPGFFTIETRGSSISYLKYPLRYTDASQFSLMINKTLNLIKI